MSIQLSHTDGVATVVLDRPDARNALSVELCNALSEAIAEIDRSDARVAVLRGEGKVFCAGADFAAVSGPGGLEFLPAFETMLEAVARCRVPVIARMHGAALGGGLQLATACDFRIAAEDTVMGIPSSRLGIVINLENVQRLVLLTGLSVAREILMTAKTYSGAAALDAGLVGAIAPEDGLDGAVDVLASTIAGLAPLSVQGAKQTLSAVTDQMLGRAHVDTSGIANLVAGAYRSEDLQEGLAAMSEKRSPSFKGR